MFVYDAKSGKTTLYDDHLPTSITRNLILIVYVSSNMATFRGGDIILRHTL